MTFRPYNPQPVQQSQFGFGYANSGNLGFMNTPGRSGGAMQSGGVTRTNNLVGSQGRVPGGPFYPSDLPDPTPNGQGTPNAFDQLVRAGFYDFGSAQRAEGARAGAVGGVADEFAQSLDTFETGMKEQVSAERGNLEGEAQRVQDLGADQVGDFEAKTKELFGDVSGRLDAATAEFEREFLDDAQATAAAVARSTQSRIAAINADPSIPDEARAELVSREIGNMETQKQSTVSPMLANLRTTMLQARQNSASVLGSLGSALTGQFLGAQAGEREMNQLASGLRSQGTMLEINATFDAQRLRLEGLTTLADLRERSIASPISLYALMATLFKDASSSSLQDRSGIDVREAQRGQPV